jgi:hypothetical protein
MIMKSVAQEETKNDAYDKKAVWRESSLVACIYHTLLAKYIEEPSISSCLPPSDLVGSSFLQGKKSHRHHHRPTDREPTTVVPPTSVRV